MNTTPIRLIAPIFFTLFVCTAYMGICQQQKSKPQNTTSQSITIKHTSDTTFTLKIENEKRVVDEALKARLTREIKAAITRNKLKKPYTIAMGFTKGARDVETFLFGEQIFYTLAESGFTITGTPLDMPDETPNTIPQVKVINQTIYIILSKL
ncbi:hypothetical protein [Emticicia fontis]